MAQKTRSTTEETTPQQGSALPSIVRCWCLRLLTEFKREDRLIGKFGFEDDELARQLGLGEFIGSDTEDIDHQGIRQALRRLAHQAQQDPGSVPPVLAANVQRTAELVGLSPLESRIFEFVVLMHAYPTLLEICKRPNNLRVREIADTLARLLHLPRQEVYQALRPEATLSRTGLLQCKPNSMFGGMDDRLELLSPALSERLTESISEPTDWLRDMVRPGQPSHLQWTDYSHLDKHLAVLRPYLRQALQQGQSGVNVFLYGPPGTGKTQLARLLAQDMGCEMFDVTTEDEDREPISGPRRLRAHCAANSFFAKQRAMILFDEVEEVFGDHEGLGQLMKLLKHSHQASSPRKGWINRILETNALPTIWVANSLQGLDPAFARRFDMVLEVPVPPRQQRERIIRQAGGELISASTVARLAESETLAPALVTQATRVVSAIRDQLGSPATDAVQLLINNTLQAQGHRPVRAHNPDALPEGYDPAFIHADIDLQEVAQLLQTARTGRLCLYGPPGTGKTAFGRWLAQQLNVPLHVRRASDLLGMYVGESEKNIARAFHEAEADGGVLLIDEVDSFLQDRQGAERSWEVSQVNEMLTQMESFGGVFIASTNLMDKLDPAVLRRFDLKVRFGPLRPAQAAQLLQRHCQQHQLPEPSAAELTQVQALARLTPGDFAAVHRQSRLRPLHSASDWVKALQAECALKPQTKTSGMGFLN